MQLIHIEPQTSGEAGGITSSLRCEIAAWRKPEEDKPSFALETCCLLSTAFSTTRLPGPLTTQRKWHWTGTTVLQSDRQTIARKALWIFRHYLNSEKITHLAPQHSVVAPTCTVLSSRPSFHLKTSYFVAAIHILEQLTYDLRWAAGPD